MAIKSRNKISTTFSIASMSDLVFLLLIFLMIGSALIAPNFFKLFLSSGSSQAIPQQSVSVSITSNQEFFVDETKVNANELQSVIASKMEGMTEGTIILKADKKVTVSEIVNILDAVNEINREKGTNHKVILAAFSKE